MPTKILIVDDDEMVREGLKTVIELRGYEVADAKNGRKAIEIIGEDDLDLIISDIDMPEMNGFQLAEFVKMKYPHIPIVLMSGKASEYEEKVKKLEIEMLLLKPIKPEKLFEVITQLIFRVGG